MTSDGRAYVKNNLSTFYQIQCWWMSVFFTKRLWTVCNVFLFCFCDNHVKSKCLSSAKVQFGCSCFVTGRLEMNVKYFVRVSWIFRRPPSVIWHKTHSRVFWWKHLRRQQVEVARASVPTCRWPALLLQMEGAWIWRAFIGGGLKSQGFVAVISRKCRLTASGVLLCESVLTKEETCHSEEEAEGWPVRDWRLPRFIVDVPLNMRKLNGTRDEAEHNGAEMTWDLFLLYIYYCF